MKVRVHPADRWGCGTYRMINPARVLASKGYDVTVIEPGQSSGMGATIMFDRLVSTSINEDIDVFVFQRPTNKYLAQLMELLRRRGKTVVIDMDDDLTCIHPSNAAFRLLHPKLSPENNWHHAEYACQHASMVTVSTPGLANKYGSHGRVQVLHNYVPEAALKIEKSEDSLDWGWPGAIHSHPDDIPIIGGAVSKLASQGYEFCVVGNPEGVGKALGLGKDPKGTGVVKLEDWFTQVARLGVSVAPLSDTRFNTMKSWLKPLEAAAVGVPCVMSDRTEYRTLAKKYKIGILVDDRTRNWVREVGRLLGDETYRVEEGQRTREIVADNLTIEKNAWRWWETWETAYKHNKTLIV